MGGPKHSFPYKKFPQSLLMYSIKQLALEANSQKNHFHSKSLSKQKIVFKISFQTGVNLNNFYDLTII